ncbi:hypothetical protein K440DRAFT_659316 [Wilcoxina mikolae CBS 423.85]|nr:hypothetical protein K440DRAFT_659316 [Wilcoxina mikolae CBS 423.85]
MSGVFNKDTKRPGELGFEYGTSEMLVAQDLADGVYEDPHDVRSAGSGGSKVFFIFPRTPMMRDHHGGMNPAKAFTSEGSVGKQFNADGSLGSIPQKAGGVFDKEGAVGKQFTDKGAIGGTVDSMLGEKKGKK